MSRDKISRTLLFTEFIVLTVGEDESQTTQAVTFRKGTSENKVLKSIGGRSMVISKKDIAIKYEMLTSEFLGLATKVEITE